MTKITLTDLVNLQNETTAVTAINDNSAVLVTAFDNTLSRDGTAPNNMAANLDMDSNRILNLPTPASNYEPIRFIDADTLGQGGSITLNPLPAGGTAEQSLIKNSSVDFDVIWASVGSVPIGGSTNQVLTKNSPAAFDTGWKNAVTSVGLSAASDFTVTSSPVTTTGTIGLNWASTPTGTGAIVRSTNPTLNTPAFSQVNNSGNIVNLPAANDTLVGRNTVDTLTNKTIAVSQLSGQLPSTNVPIFVGDVTTAGGSLTTSISANAVTNGQQALMNAFTIKGNATSSAANPTDISIPALTQKSSPSAGDMLLIADSTAGNALKFATASSISSVGSVGSVGGLVGAITLGSGLATSGNTILADPALVGEIRQVAFNRVPPNFLACNGNTQLRASYPLLYAALVVSSTITITIATPAVVTWTGNQLQNNDPIFFTTTGALPSGLAINTMYYVKSLSGNTFSVSASPQGSAINTSGSQSGTHTGLNAPWEPGAAIGNGSTTFTLPNYNGYFLRGIDNASGIDQNPRAFGVAEAGSFLAHTHGVTDPSHGHSVRVFSNQTTASAVSQGSGSQTANATTDNATTGISINSAGGLETRPVNQTILYIIRYQ